MQPLWSTDMPKATFNGLQANRMCSQSIQTQSQCCLQLRKCRAAARQTGCLGLSVTGGLRCLCTRCLGSCWQPKRRSCTPGLSSYPDLTTIFTMHTES